MGGCCSTQGTADGTSGAPPARDKAKAAGMRTADPKAPAAAVAKKTPPEKAEGKAPAHAAPPTASPSGASAPHAHPAEEKKVPAATAPPAAQAAHPDKKEEQKPPADPADAPVKNRSPPTPPPAPNAAKTPAQASASATDSQTRTPPAVSRTAKPEEREKSAEATKPAAPPSLKVEEPSSFRLGNSPNSTLITRAFPSLEELKATPPPPPSLHREEAAEPEKAAVEFSLPPPPETLKASPVCLTPERAQPPQFMSHTNKEGDEDNNTRGPSTARVEEVPPTPARESDVATGKALPADDARVLQRVPPPPPPPMLSAPSANETPHEEPEKEEEEEAEEAETLSNPLADILRRQHEEKQRYPTALTTDAMDDAPLEISMEEDKSGAATPATAAAAAATGPTGAAKYITSDADNAKEAHAAAAETKTPLAEPETVTATALAPTGDMGHNAVAAEKPVPAGGLVYKILLREDWQQLQSTGEFRGNATDLAAGCIKLATADQAAEAAARFEPDNTPFVIVCCAVAALSRPAATDNEGASPLRWEAEPLIGQRTPRLYRPLRRDSDVLWFKACASATEVAERLRKDVVISDSGSEDDVPATGDEPEKMVFKGYEDDVDNRPISFTDTSEVERQLAERIGGGGANDDKFNVDNDNEQDMDSSIDMPHNKPHGSGNKNVNDGATAHNIKEDMDHAEEEEEDKPRPIVKGVVPDIALTPPAGQPLGTRAPTQHVVSAMQAPEATPELQQEGRNGGIVAPRRVPPPLPSPSVELNNTASDVNKAGVKAAEATPPPPSRPAPPAILSPAPQA